MFKAKKYLDMKINEIEMDEEVENHETEIKGYKKIIEEIFGYKWEELENMTELRVRWMFFNFKELYSEWVYKKLGEFYQERSTYLDTEGNFIEEKVVEKIKEREEEEIERTGLNYIDFIIDIYQKKGETIINSPEIENLFEEVKTYQNHIKAFVNEKDEKIYLIMVEYSMDHYENDLVVYTNPEYEEYGIEESGELRLILTEERYWPKNDAIQEQMKAAKKEADFKKSPDSEYGYYDEYKHLFEYRFGKSRWVNYFFDKNTVLRKKYNGYKVVSLLGFTSLITGDIELLDFNFEVKLTDDEKTTKKHITAYSNKISTNK